MGASRYKYLDHAAVRNLARPNISRGASNQLDILSINSVLAQRMEQVTRVLLRHLFGGKKALWLKLANEWSVTLLAEVDVLMRAKHLLTLIREVSPSVYLAGGL